MSKESDQIKSRVIVAIISALLVGGTTPWWFERLFGSVDNPGPKSVPGSVPPASSTSGGTGPQQTVDPSDSPTLPTTETPPPELTLLQASNRLISKISASSELDSQTYNKQIRTYGVSNVTDQDITTAWVEGVDGDGIGEWIEITFNQKVKLRRLSLISGYTADRYRFEINNRVKSIEISLEGGYSQTYQLKDTMLAQDIVLDSIYESSWLRLRIVEVYKGKKYADTAISEINF